MFNNAKRGDLFKTNIGRKAIFWYQVPNKDEYFLTLAGSAPGIFVDGQGKNHMEYRKDADEYFETRMSWIFEVSIIGPWTDDDEALELQKNAGQKRKVYIKQLHEESNPIVNLNSFNPETPEQDD